MKTYFLLLIVSSIANYSLAQKITTIYLDETEFQDSIIILNKVKKVSIFNYTIKKNEIVDSSLLNVWLYNYDALGRLISEEKQDNVGQGRYKYSFEYLGSSKAVSRKISENLLTNRLSFIDKTTIYEYKYNNNGKLDLTSEFNEEKTRVKHDKVIYDSNNREIEIRTQINNEKYKLSRQFYYDFNGNLVKTKCYLSGKYAYANNYEYNKEDNSKRSYLENDDGIKLESEEFFNTQKQLVKKKIQAKPFFSSTIENIVDEYSYYTNGLLFEWKEKNDGKLVLIHRYYYQAE